MAKVNKQDLTIQQVQQIADAFKGQVSADDVSSAKMLLRSGWKWSQICRDGDYVGQGAKSAAALLQAIQ